MGAECSPAGEFCLTGPDRLERAPLRLGQELAAMLDALHAMSPAMMPLTKPSPHAGAYGDRR